MRAVGIDPVEGIVRQGGLDRIGGVVCLGNKVAVHIPLGVFRQGEMQRAVHKAEAQHTGQQDPAPLPLAAAEMPEQPKKDDAQHRHAEQRPEPGRLLQHAKAEAAVTVLVGQHGKDRRRQRDEGRQPKGARQAALSQCRAGEQAAGGAAQHKDRHIVPSRVKAGIKGVERAVQHRHKGTDHADL